MFPTLIQTVYREMTSNKGQSLADAEPELEERQSMKVDADLDKH